MIRGTQQHSLEQKHGQLEYSLTVSGCTPGRGTTGKTRGEKTGNLCKKKKKTQPKNATSGRNRHGPTHGARCSLKGNDDHEAKVTAMCRKI